MLRLPSLLLSMLLIAGGPAGATPTDTAPVSITRPEFAQLTEEVIAPTVQLARNCSGVVVHSDRDEASGDVLTLVLTAKHCTASVGQPIEVILPVYVDNRIVREEVYRAVVAGQYAGHDLAYLRLLDTDTLLPVAAVAPRGTVLYEGEPVWAVGYPMGHSRVLTDGALGTLEMLEEDGRWVEYLRSTPLVMGGNSGGPVFHMSAGGHYEVFSIVSRGYPSNSWMNYHVPMTAIHAFMETMMRVEARRLEMASQ